jgi:tetratricopeptide (TPR) repeat protein
LGDQRPGNPSIQDRRGALQDRLGGREQIRDDRQQGRGDRQENRQETRGDRQETRGDRQENRQETRGDRQENRQEIRGDRQETRGERQENRQENRQDLRSDWQDHRDEIRDDWQQYRDDAREDWQGWFDDHYGRYGGWYSGYAPGYWGQSDYLWDNYPVAAVAGLTWWGANSLGYQFGYSDYYNPYYTESMPAYYTEPILTPSIEPILVEPIQGTAVAPSLPPGVSSEGVTKFDQARAAFLDGRYDDALKLTDSALTQMPRDAVLHEFRALVLFALQRYAEAAATLHAVLDVGPGWDWKTMSSLYPSLDTYTYQLRSLENALKKTPKDAAERFLLGYHYLTCGHPEEALNEFRQASELKPNDSVTASLVATLSPRDAQPAQAPAGATPKAIPSDSIVGNWTAAGKSTSKYAMNLRKDGSFTWEFTRGTRKQSVKGVYTVEDNVLAMEPDSGGVMLAELTVKDPDNLHFKMIGGASDDPGLGFRRESSKQGG